MLVRHLALELAAELHSQRVVAAAFTRERKTLTLQFQNRTLLWDAQSGGLDWGSAAVALDTPLTLPRHAAVTSVRGLPDERVLRIELSGGARANAAHILVIELLGGQRNVIALDEQERVLKQLAPQGRTRQQRGQPYAPPAPRRRRGTSEALTVQEWLDVLQPVQPAERAATLIEHVAYTSRINATALLEPADLTAGYERYRELISTDPNAVVVLIQGQRQPYGHALWQTDAAKFETLIGAIASIREAGTAEPPAALRLERAVERAQGKLARLRAESNSASEQAVDLRAAADLLLANAHALKRGSREIELIGFDGAPVRLELDPSMNGAEQAQAWYEKARKRERAAEQLPALIQAAEQELGKAATLLERARAGESIEVPASPTQRSRPAQPTQSLPYRRYSTTGGLEVRVGRSSRGNDELTMRHSSPNDIWLHARQTGGAHVVLRWNDATAPPPRQDLIQAATLAALHSKARHAGTVPVDWTRRKYVRKPRGSPAGQVQVERTKTLFVEPRPELEEQLRWKD